MEIVSTKFKVPVKCLHELSMKNDQGSINILNVIYSGLEVKKKKKQKNIIDDYYMSTKPSRLQCLLRFRLNSWRI